MNTPYEHVFEEAPVECIISKRALKNNHIFHRAEEKAAL